MSCELTYSHLSIMGNLRARPGLGEAEGEVGESLVAGESVILKMHPHLPTPWINFSPHLVIFASSKSFGHGLNNTSP